jgi:kinesin light chain
MASSQTAATMKDYHIKKIDEIGEKTSPTMTHDEIISSTKTVVQGLETLRMEHNQVLNGLQTCVTAGNKTEPSLAEEKMTLLKKSLEMIELAMGEAQVMVAFSGHMEYLESEKQKLKAQVRRLCQENSWLRDELAATQQRLQQSEQKCAALEEEKTHLEFMSQMRKYDSATGQNEQEKESDTTSLNIDLGFQADDDDEHQQTGFNSQPPGGASSMSVGGGYEIPVRLRTLHNLVVQYASQGRYEVCSTM